MSNADQSPSVGKPRITGARKFYLFGPDVTGGGRGHGLVFVNEDKLLSPPRIIVRPEEGGFPPLPEKPQIVYDPKIGDTPRDLEGGMSGYWFVSERLKQVFETVDPEGFAFAECDYTLPDGSRGPKHYLCDVLRVLDVLDEDRSRMKPPTIYPGGEKVYDFAGQPSLSFKEKAIGEGDTFRLLFRQSMTFCDEVLFKACQANRKLSGIRFRDASNL